MIKEKLSQIRLVLMDVDGVLTDGKVVYDGDGSEIKQFNVKDGLGIRFLIEAGIYVGIITGRSSDALSYRCCDLGINYLKDAVVDKGSALEELLLESKIPPENTIFIGDDLPDLPAMIRVGFPIAVADADDNVLQASVLVTEARGGQGAIREVAELILKSKGYWEGLVKRFIR